jgi:SNF2 family DNA or RNA helicase
MINDFNKIKINEKFYILNIILTELLECKKIKKDNYLVVNEYNLDFSEKEISEIFNTYRLKKKYYRLKDGSYINLESSGIDTLVNIADNLGISAKELAKGTIELPKYRAVYIDGLVKKDPDIIMTKENSFKEIIRDINEASDTDFVEPNEMKDVLRSYQITGFKWLKTLEKYNFGGILADDMGLGKTIQIIALLIDAKKNKQDTSIVVCPSSLYINWQKEISRFAPELTTLIISGSAEEREVLIKKASKYDVIITSYDLLKRDIEKYEKTSFKYVIADEAQYIKNNNTKNAKALKKLNSEIRFALTGTPMENSLSELWSIFDFVMPGYLFSYKRFREEFESPIIKDDSKEAMSRLQSLVSPFILRRIKKDVLKELPDKTETIMYSEMTHEQSKLYKSYLLKAKNEMNAEIKDKGFENSQIKILSLITRLRQLCCHPSLFIENYEDESSKLNQCIELIEGAINSGHKILLFSQFTSMLDIIKKELDSKKIKYYILTGQTKVDTRIELVESFNKSKDVGVFLISLKAGGTGLNLTGADMVIHYDPWWNLSAQNQATDRAYRIGQKSNVQVFKLITENSIEEKIQKLQDKKMDLTNSVIKEGETFINKMSKEEILDLFEI